MRPIKQRPFFIGLLSNLVVDRTLRGCGLSPENPCLDRAAYEAVVPIIPPRQGKHVLREDVEVPSADGVTCNGARLYTPVELDEIESEPIIVYIHGGGWMLGSCFTQPVRHTAAVQTLNKHPYQFLSLILYSIPRVEYSTTRSARACARTRAGAC